MIIQLFIFSFLFLFILSRMKKTVLLFSLFSLLSSLGVVLGYTGIDESNANFLATEHIIVDHADAPAQYRFDDKIIRQEMVAIALKIK